MKALINRRTIIIASIAFLIAFITLISVNAFNNAGPVTGIANTITRPIRALATTVAGTFGDIYAALYRYEDLERRNEELMNQIAELHYVYRETTEIAEENNRLRDLVAFRRRHGGYAHVQASFEGWTSDNWTHTFRINRGYTNSNITPGMGVATEGGILLGQILSVGATSSIVITVLDTRFSAAVFFGGETLEDSDGTALVKGDFTQLRNGLLVIDYIDDHIAVNQGTYVVTSGLGGIFPSGLTVGLVEMVHNHANGIGRYATVRPSSPFDSLSLVYVIIGFGDTDDNAPILEPDETEDAEDTDDLEDMIDLSDLLID